MFSLRKEMFDHLNKNLFYPNFYKRFLFKLCKIISIFLSKNMYMIQDKHTYSFDDSFILLVNSCTDISDETMPA